MSCLVRVSAYLVPWVTLVNLCFRVVHSLVLQLEGIETKVSLGHMTNALDAKAHAGSILEHWVYFVAHHCWDISAAHRTPRWPSASPSHASFFR